MIKTRCITVMIFALICSNAGFACDPIAINWDHFYAVNDKNKDKKIQQAEWQKLSFKGSNYDAGFESTLPPAQIFQQLDSNKNAVLDGEEIDAIYRYLPNPCADFDMRNSSDAKHQPLSRLDKFKAFLEGLF